ncbi:MAG TPA: signal peptide peptidase SppA [Myxococcales bacterium]|nr:signal peptide peptidase SppA [Myxococcales bacterium]
MRPPLLLLALVAAPLAARAQTATLSSLDPSRGANLPPTGAALADEAFAAAVNPAGLTHANGLQLNYAFERSFARAQTAHGVFLSAGGGLSAALAADWVGGAVEHRRFSWALAAGSPLLSFGFTYHWLGSSDPALDGLGGLDVGALSRPLPQLSLAAVVRNADQPAGSPSPRSYAVALGLRPLGERATLGVDYLFADAGLLQGRLQYTLQAEVFRGLRLSAGASHGLGAADELMFQLGVTLDAGGTGLTYAVGSSRDGLSQEGLLRLSSRRARDITAAGGTVALFDLPDLLRGSGTLSLLGLGGEDPYLRVTRLLEAAERDDSLRGVVLKIDDLPNTGLAKVEELRQSVLRLRRAGKKVVAVILKAEDPEYLLASAADRVYALPQSVIEIDGLRARVEFVGGTMQKLGVSWDVARVGAFKNSPDQLTRTDMSAEQREALTAYLDATFQQLQAGLAPRLTPEAFNRALQAALLPPAAARELGLVDEVISPQELDRKVQELVPGARFEPSYAPFSRRDEAWGRRRQIAVVPVVGTIAGGKSRQDGLTGAAIAGAETVIRALAEAAADGQVAAIVLRVDSPGGDGLASDLMYRAVLEAREKKPVVASMGDKAGSGGYYTAMGAHEIYASPATLTGSIGVFFLKPAVGELLGTLGVTAQVLTRGKFADFSSELRPWTQEERQIAQRWVDAFYDGFITEAARSRGTTKERIDAVARGRIWSGADAKARGLVDQLGGLHDAIAAARRRAGLPPGEQVDLVEYGGAHSPLSPIGGEEGVLQPAAALLPAPAKEPPPLGRWLDPGVAPEVLLGGKVLAVDAAWVTVR